MSEPIKEDVIEYNGWGPCVHSDEEKAKFKDWLNAILQNQIQPPDENDIYTGGIIESLVWGLNFLGASVTFDSDQWVGVSGSGRIYYDKHKKFKEVKTFIEGDTFLIAVAETYRWWKAKWEELNGKKFE